MSGGGSAEERILVLAPSANDGPETLRVLRNAGFECALARDIDELCELLEAGAAATMIAEEVLTAASARRLAAFLSSQEPWSDLPIIVFTDAARATRSVVATLDALAPLGNITALNRPLDLVTVISAAKAALRARHRQYAARAMLVELREADRRKNQFLAVLSHELRNPLSPIATGLYILNHAAPGGEREKRAKQIIGRQVTQLTNLVNDLLDATRIARNKVRLNKERVELNELVRGAVEDNRSLFEVADVALELQPAPQAVPVLADRTRIAQVVSNLLQNAAKFTGKGGRVRILVASAGHEATVRVADSGVGMASETLAHVFEPFVQADQTLDRSRGGLGLGLALVKGLVELHGGTVSAQSEGLGKGAEFVLTLPIDVGVALEALPTRVAKPRSQRRVLVIEDNAEAAEILSEALQLNDHQVDIAYNGPEALVKAREFQPDVVLCDIGLPGMDGFDVAKAFRADEQIRDTFLVALSGYAQPEDLQRAADAGFDRHLAKPPSLEMLEELLANVPRRGELVTRRDWRGQESEFHLA